MNSIWFYHYRLNNPLNDSLLPKGGLTVACSRDGDDILVGIAACSLADNFNRKLGRDIARGRLHDRPHCIPMDIHGLESGRMPTAPEIINLLSKVSDDDLWWPQDFGSINIGVAWLRKVSRPCVAVAPTIKPATRRRQRPAREADSGDLQRGSNPTD